MSQHKFEYEDFLFVREAIIHDFGFIRFGKAK